MIRRLSLAIYSILFLASPLIGREWSDRSGKHRVEATLVEVTDSSVRLKKPDGKVVTLSLDQLSQADRDFLAAESGAPAKGVTKKDAEPQDEKDASTQDKKDATSGPISKVTTFNDLETLAKKQTTAAAAVTLYKLFLRDPKIENGEKAHAKEQLSTWEHLKTDDAVHVGNKWLTAAERQELRAEEVKLVVEATKLSQTGSASLVEEKLNSAKRTNPTGATASMLLGLYHALAMKNAQAAEKDFAECVKRLKRIETLSNEDRANLLASLNNLAIAEARQKKHASAVKHWKEAADIGTPPIEVVQNVGRFVHLAHAVPMLSIPKDAEKSAGNLFASLASTAKGKSFSEHIGWLYIGVFTFADKSKQDDPQKSAASAADKKRPKDGDAIPVASGSGFVVQPGYVMTNHHVIDGADEVEIHTQRNQDVTYKARVVAVSPKVDMALLECKELTAAPVPLSTDPPKLATELLVLGYPERQALGSKLKSVKGSVSGLPDPETENLLLYDALINAGSSGGPVCDQRGRILALNRLYYVLANKIGGGVPAAVVLEFLKKELPAFQQPPASEKVLEWPQVAETVGESTVLVVNLMSPAKAHSLGGDTEKKRGRRDNAYAYEDPWCMFCAGTGQVDCPVKGCTKGVVGGARCTKCGGMGHVRCPHCISGIDLSVLGGRTR